MNIQKQMLAVQEELTAITKDQKNGQQGWRFRGVDDVMNTLHPILVKHQVFVTPEVLDIKRTSTATAKGTVLNYATVTVKYTFYTDDGVGLSVVSAGEGMDSGDKATAKAMSIAYKYAMFQTFCIPTEDDPDREVYEAAVPSDTDTALKKMDVALWLESKVLTKEQEEFLKKLDANFSLAEYNKIKASVEALPNKQGAIK